MLKTSFIFAGSIAVAIVLTIIAMTALDSELPSQEVTEDATPLGTFFYPEGVAVNGTYIYVADTQNSRVQVFNPDGSFNATFGFPGNGINDGSLNRPTGIHVNGSGHVFVSSTFRDVVKVWDPAFAWVQTIGTPGTGTDEYYRPAGIDSNSTNVFIADAFNNRIVITDLSGNSVDTIP